MKNLVIGGGIAALLWAASRQSRTVPVGVTDDLQPGPVSAPASAPVEHYSGNVAASIVSPPVILSPTAISASAAASPSPARQIPISQLEPRAIYSSVSPRMRMLASL